MTTPKSEITFTDIKPKFSVGELVVNSRAP